MYTFFDQSGCKVELSFGNNKEENKAKHVFVICKYNDCWLLTNHKTRGLEFPGGKVENEELPKEAAFRETYEETGGIIKSIEYIGQYRVYSEETIIKNIYFAYVGEIQETKSYFETKGPSMLKELPDDIKNNEIFSFIMKDEVVTLAMEYIAELESEQ